MDVRARRATLEDVPQLTALWRLDQLPAEALEKKFTEFQVVADPAGQVLAAIGLQISGSSGLLYGEAIARAEHTDSFRELLWQRIQMVCRNHSVDRLWTRLTFPFLRTRGFAPATEEQIELLPAEFGEPAGAWQLLHLRSGEASNEAIEKQFAMLKAMHHAEADRLQRQTRTLKGIALVLVVLVSILVITWAVVMLKYGPRLLQRQ